MKANIFEHNAQLLRALKHDIDVAFTHRHLDEEHRSLWATACQRFHASFEELAFPGGLNKQLQHLRKGEEEAVEMAVRFLEVNPWFFRSGYIKEELLRLIKQASLSDDQQERLRSVILARIEGGGGREFRRYSRLARKLSVPKFREAVLKLLQSDDPQVARRARWVLSSLEQ